MISETTLRDWLREGESDKLEFKLSFGHDAIETLVAFANAKGGIVLLGISDAGEIIGVSLSKESINQWVNEVKSKTAPQVVPNVDTLNIKGKEIVCLSITEYPVKPIAFRGRYFKRVANSNHLLSVSEVANMHLQSINSSWDFYLRNGKDISSISFEKVYNQIEKIQQRSQQTAIQLKTNKFI